MAKEKITQTLSINANMLNERVLLGDDGEGLEMVEEAEVMLNWGKKLPSHFLPLQLVFSCIFGHLTDGPTGRRVCTDIRTNSLPYPIYRVAWMRVKNVLCNFVSMRDRHGTFETRMTNLTSSIPLCYLSFLRLKR